MDVHGFRTFLYTIVLRVFAMGKVKVIHEYDYPVYPLCHKKWRIFVMKQLQFSLHSVFCGGETGLMRVASDTCSPICSRRKKQMKTILKTAAPLAIAMLASSAAATNLLNNASFESDLGFDFSNVTNWNGFFGGTPGTFLEAFNTTGATPNSGAKALVTTIRAGSSTNGGLDGFTGHVQTVFGITAGSIYELSVFARTNPNINNGAEYRIEWFDAGNTFISASNQSIQGLLTSTYQQFSYSEVAPANASIAKVVFAVQSFTNNGSPADTSVAWDDASLTVVPAPSAAGLLAIGGLLAARRRR